MAEKPAVKIVFFTTSCPSTLKVRGDIERITQILTAKRIQYEEIDLNMYPERRRELLLFKDGVTSLPQLRVNGVYVGDGETVQELEDFGELDEVLEDVNLANAEGNVALHWACLNGHVEIVKLLMEAGASPSALNSYDRTPIDEALNHMRCDDILAVINAAASRGGIAQNEDSFDFEAADAAGTSGFPQKPQ